VFGVDDDEATLVTQSVQHTKKSDKKEARDNCGNVVAVAYYNVTSEVTVEGIGTSTLAVGAALTLAGTGLGTVSGALYVDEVTVEKNNEEFIKSTVKATAYTGIPVV